LPTFVDHDPKLFLTLVGDGRCISNECYRTNNVTVERGGSIVIPAFAVGRTQSLLYYLYKLKEKNRIPDIPIYLNSPMATSVSDLYCKHSKSHKLNDKEIADICNVAQFVRTQEESIALNRSPSPMIIISASGMATGGRVLHHLKRFLPDDKSTILFTGSSLVEPIFVSSNNGKKFYSN